MIRQKLKDVKDSRVMTMQFIDRNTIHGTRVYQRLPHSLSRSVQPASPALQAMLDAGYRYT